MNQLDEFGILRDHRIDPLEFPVGLHQTGQRLDGLVKDGSCATIFLRIFAPCVTVVIL
jgi:hypothetical protein